MAGMPVEPLKLVVPVTYILWYLAYLVFGVSAVSEDWGLASTFCGKTTHLFKFSVLALVSAGVELVSYVAFPGGGEGARARAIVLMGVYFALMVWGALMWANFDTSCAAVLGGKSVEDYALVFTFQHIATIHNGVMLALMIVHEAYLGKWLQADCTLLPVKHYIVKGQEAQAGTQYYSPASQVDTFGGLQEVPNQGPNMLPVDSSSDLNPAVQVKSEIYGDIFEDNKSA